MALKPYLIAKVYACFYGINLRLTYKIKRRLP